MSTTGSLPLIRQLFAHAAWANALVLAGLRETPGSDPHVREQFAHLLAAEHVWLVRILGTPQALAVWPSLGLDECERVARENQDGYAALLEEETEDSLQRDVAYTNSAGRSFSTRLVDILLHVGMHGSYHRGMISILTRRSGGTPVPSDYIAFVRGAPTATRADDRR